MIVTASIATFSLSLAESVELLASKTEVYKGESVLLVAMAKFEATVTVNKIEIFEDGMKIKECTDFPGSQYVCYVVVKKDICPVSKEYFANVTYTKDGQTSAIQSNRITITWKCPYVYIPEIPPEERICLDFEKVENRILEDNKVNVFLRNCGNFALYNVTVMFVIDENVQMKVIPSILPNEVKFVYFYVDVKSGERKLASVFAFNNLINVKYDFFVERVSPISTLKIEVPEIKLVKGKWNEFFVTIKNFDTKSLENLEVKVESEKGIVANLENSKISLLPLQTKNIKLSVFVSEDFEKDYTNIKINVGGVEKVFKVSVIKEVKEGILEKLASYSVLLVLLLAVVLIVVIISLLVKLAERGRKYKERIEI